MWKAPFVLLTLLKSFLFKSQIIDGFDINNSLLHNFNSQSDKSFKKTTISKFKKLITIRTCSLFCHFKLFTVSKNIVRDKGNFSGLKLMISPIIGFEIKHFVVLYYEATTKLLQLIEWLNSAPPQPMSGRLTIHSK